ncbi:hypothetical protein PQU96_05065 [Vogesella sp. LYT5W]|uniref:FimV N-terminal domain-containing protein n=1 Tax=Vogesella margarita TaxID=2984199 RepID=A0ABT5IMH0_9NEIS|nr:FimV/HubP family polar landmark protein [Vogesella margarita]MDC7713510.1 hypothetical protein [Vogesella margarita]
MLSVAFSSAAWAGLGGVVVKSNLGEPLRAEIELSGSDGEVQRVGLAALDTFRELKVDYAPLLSSLRFTLAQRANGRPYIRVTSLAPISEPYLRFVVEAKMSSSRSVREYTVLLDPVDYALPSSPAPAAVRPQGERLTPAPAPRLPAVPRAERDVLPRVAPDRISVHPGQTLNQLAASLALPDVSLRQVMAALLEANPQAFVAGNPDQLRAGARLKVPPLSKIRTLGRERSNSILDAGRAPQATAAAPAAAPATVPAVPAKAEPAPEQLVKLEPVTAPASVPAVDASAVVSEQALQLQQAQQKITELEKRLNALQAAAAPQTAPPAEERGEPLLDQVMAYLPLIGGALAAVLLGLAAIIMLRRRRAAGTGHAGAASTLRKQPLQQSNTEPLVAGNTFLTDFTRNGIGGAEAGDVDPIAEAEVYLAYGRDQQAEEILKEALAKDPTLHDVRAKLLEIYASRQDRSAFEPHARALHDALDGQGTLWDKIAKLGRGIDPANALYGGVAVATEAVADNAIVASAMDIDLDNELMGSMPAAATLAEPVAAAAGAVDDDPLRAALLGDDPFGADAAPKALAPELDIESLLADAEQVVAEPVPAEPVAEENKHMLDFDFQLDEPVSEASPLETLAAAEPDANSIDFDFSLDGLGAETPAVSTAGLSVSDDPLSTKLDLARVYLDMGDKDGAREVLEELVAEADGSLKQEAANLLSSL